MKTVQYHPIPRVTPQSAVRSPHFDEGRANAENEGDNIGIGGFIILFIVVICFVAAMWWERFVLWLTSRRCKRCCDREVSNIINFPDHGRSQREVKQTIEKRLRNFYNHGHE
jgi:hypothetical protein